LSINELANLAVDTIKPMAIQHNITIDSNIEKGITIEADHDELEIIFNNLLSNAVKYNRNGGKVSLNITSNDANITITVSDTGIGISTEDLPKLFEEFSRIKNSDTRNITGTGLGLSITKKWWNSITELSKLIVNQTLEPTFKVVLPF